MEDHEAQVSDDSGLKDHALVESYRSGDPAAAGTLFERHRKAALGYARHLAGPSNAEDVASEAFLKTLRAIESGNGPTSNFRAYLLTTIHNTYVSLVRADAQVVLQPDFDTAAMEEPTEEEDASLRAIAEAFAGLPERWQTVLWFTLIERHSLEETAAIMGITPQAVGSLRYRARNGLYEAVLAQLPNRDAECAAVRRLLRRDPQQLTRRNKRLINNHLPDCDRCDRAAKAAPFGPVPALAIVAGSMLGGAYFLIGPPELAAAAVAPAAAPAASGGAGGGSGSGGSGAGSGGGAGGGAGAGGGLSTSLILPAAVILVLVLIIAAVLLSQAKPGDVANDPPPAAPIAPPADTNSAAPPSEPPTTQPPATQPPATQPPATQPPATQPPAPTTEPPATQPPPTSSTTPSVPPPTSSDTPPESPAAPATDPPAPPPTTPAEPPRRDPRFQNVTVANPSDGSYDVTFEPSDAASSTKIDFEIAGLRDVRLAWGPDVPAMSCSAPVDGRFRCQVRAPIPDGKVTVRLRTEGPLRGSMTMIDSARDDADPSNNKIVLG